MRGKGALLVYGKRKRENPPLVLSINLIRVSVTKERQFYPGCAAGSRLGTRAGLKGTGPVDIGISHTGQKQKKQKQKQSRDTPRTWHSGGNSGRQFQTDGPLRSRQLTLRFPVGNWYLISVEGTCASFLQALRSAGPTHEGVREAALCPKREPTQINHTERWVEETPGRNT